MVQLEMPIKLLKPVADIQFSAVALSKDKMGNQKGKQLLALLAMKPIAKKKQSK